MLIVKHFGLPKQQQQRFGEREEKMTRSWNWTLVSVQKKSTWNKGESPITRSPPFTAHQEDIRRIICGLTTLFNCIYCAALHSTMGSLTAKPSTLQCVAARPPAWLAGEFSEAENRFILKMAALNCVHNGELSQGRTQPTELFSSAPAGSQTEHFFSAPKVHW